MEALATRRLRAVGAPSGDAFEILVIMFIVLLLLGG
jgi:hypothetical protein